MNKFDVIIVGAGPAGIYCAYELVEKDPNLKVLLIEKGNDIYNRRCPVLEHKVAKCPIVRGVSGCQPACSITDGFGGAGAYSDGKFNITSEFGGWMTDYLDPYLVEDLIKYVDNINLKFGATTQITDPDTPEVLDIEKRAIAVGLKLLRAKVRHLGTEQNLEILKKIYHHLEERITMVFKTKVTEVMIEGNTIKGIKTANDEYYADKVVLAVGRDGAKWLSDVCTSNGIRMSNNQVDVGVRVETNDIIMEEINKHLYEGKFLYRSSVGTTVRTFCSNPSGHVVVENHSGIMLANGHAYNDPSLGSRNTNFALLVSHKFSEPFDKPNEYASEVSRLANQLSMGSVIIQRYGDLKRGRRSNKNRIEEGLVRPTLAATPGDLSLVLPKRILDGIIEMIYALDKIAPGTANDDTLLYGVEVKFYNMEVALDENLETKYKGLYVIGDGSGVTHSLSHASASGVYVARKIAEGI